MAYLDKYKQCSERLAAAQQLYQATRDNISGTRQELSSHIETIHDLLARQSSIILLVNSTVEAGERLYTSTGNEGREIIRQQLLDLQQALEALYDNVTLSEREIQAKISRWSGFDECSEAFEAWLKNAEAHLKSEIELKTTLDEKRAQLQIYRTFLHDAQTHQQDLFNLRDKADSLPERPEKIEKVLNDLNRRHATVLKRASGFVERYDDLVILHTVVKNLINNLRMCILFRFLQIRRYCQ